MNLLRLIALLIYTFGIFAYGAIFVLWLRRMFQTRGFTAGRDAGAPRCTDEWVAGAITFLSFSWFVVGLLQVLVSLNPEIRSHSLKSIMFFQVFLFPPLVMHNVYAESRAGCGWAATGERTGSGPPGPAFRLPIGVAYLLSPAIAVFCLLGFYGFLPWPRPWFGRIGGVSIALLFGAAMVYSVLVSTRRRRRPATDRERASRNWMLGLFLFVFLMCVLMVLVNFGWLPFSELMGITLRSIPLLFLFVSTYFESRFDFFDRLIKRGLYLFATILLLTAYFGAVLPGLEVILTGGGEGDAASVRWVRPYLYAVALVPVVLVLPWMFRRLEKWIDHAWLGRDLSSVEAIKLFLSTLRNATSERQLVEEGENGISSIFHAPARIDLELRGTRPSGFPVTLEVPLRSGGRSPGTLRLGPRAGRTPYFREDVALLNSLGEVFTFLLENLRLQRKEQEQERRARELSLQASHSELKALRAQINPHFLFNALNAIAGLIHKNPLRADKTVEQLAEVFRYTLRGSETEWHPVEEEMEFVRAYLEVEKSRFGSRLEFRIDLEEEVRAVPVPTLIVQTLVENALKHGVAAVRGTGGVEVRCYGEGNQLRIQVSDNGPGFPAESVPRPGTRRGHRFGLKSIRERLHGYFGDDAGLEIDRDDAGGMTRVAVRMPRIHRHEGMGPAVRERPAGSRRGRRP